MISKLQWKTRTLTLLQRTVIHIPSQSRNIHGNARQIFQICNITQKFEGTSLLDRQFVTRGNSDLKPSFYCEIAKYPILSILVFFKIIMRYRCSQEGSSQLQNNELNMYLPLMSKLVEALQCWLYTTTVQLALKKIKIVLLGPSFRY